MKIINHIAVFTSGGDAPGMNACIRAVVRTGIFNGMTVTGIMHGYRGMIEGEFEPLKSHSVSNIIQRGGTILKTARSEEFKTDAGMEKAYAHLKKLGIDAVVAIGGDGTFTGAHRFMKKFPDMHFIGCPGTIDNDLSGTDFTIGYDTATNTVVDAVDKIRDTAASHDRLFFIEVMGRDSGMIALETGIGTGAEAVLIPETKTYIDELARKLGQGYSREKSSHIIIVAEGDDSGGAYKIAAAMKEKFPKFDMRVTVLGHLQRGGNPSCADRVLASRLGYEAVEALAKGKSGVMVGQVHGKIVLTPFEKAIRDEGKMDMKLVKMAEILSL